MFQCNTIPLYFVNAVVCQERLVSNLEVLMHFNNVQELTALHLQVHLLDRLLSADSPYLSPCQENGMNRDILFQIQAVDWSLDNDRLFKLISGTVAQLWRSLFLKNLFPMVSDNSSQQQIVVRGSLLYLLLNEQYKFNYVSTQVNDFILFLCTRCFILGSAFDLDVRQWRQKLHHERGSLFIAYMFL